MTDMDYFKLLVAAAIASGMCPDDAIDTARTTIERTELALRPAVFEPGPDAA